MSKFIASGNEPEINKCNPLKLKLMFIFNYKIKKK
jgi:hypothetical protein